MIWEQLDRFLERLVACLQVTILLKKIGRLDEIGFCESYYLENVSYRVGQVSVVETRLEHHWRQTLSSLEKRLGLEETKETGQFELVIGQIENNKSHQVNSIVRHFQNSEIIVSLRVIVVVNQRQTETLIRQAVKQIES